MKTELSWRETQVKRYANTDAQNLSYDYFKSLVGLSVLTVGGMVSIGGGVFEQSLSKNDLFLSVALVACAGVIAFQAQYRIIQISEGGEGSWWLRVARMAVAVFFGLGVGTFIGGVFL